MLSGFTGCKVNKKNQLYFYVVAINNWKSKLSIELLKIIPVNLKYLLLILPKYVEDFNIENHKTFGERSQVRPKFIERNVFMG